MFIRNDKVNPARRAIALLIPLIATSAIADDPYQYRSKILAPTTSYVVACKSYLDELDPDVAYPNATELCTFATAGEYEPLTFVIYATQDLSKIDVIATDLRGPAHTIPKDHLDIRLVVRGPRRKTYRSPPEDSRVVSRFLFPFAAFDLAEGHFREIWFTIHVPEDATPGLYAGTIQIVPGNAPPTHLPLTLEVLPFTLPQPSQKRYGVYHRVDPDSADVDRTRAELADILHHGGTLIYPHLSIEFAKTKSGKITIGYDRIRKGV